MLEELPNKPMDERNENANLAPDPETEKLNAEHQKPAEVGDLENKDGGDKKVEAQITDLHEGQVAQEQLKEIGGKEMEASADKWARQQAATNAGESFAEKTAESQSENPQNPDVANKTTRRSFLGKIAMGAALIAGGAGLYKAGQRGMKMHKAAVERPKIQERTGVDLAEIGEGHNFDIDLEVESDGPYVVHIGQTHSISLNDPEHQKQIIVAQKDIEGAILDIQEKGLADDVYVEGLSKDHLDFLNLVKKEKKLIEGMDPTASNFYSLVDDLSSADRYVSQRKTTDGIAMSMIMKSHYALPKIADMERYFEGHPPKFDLDFEKAMREERDKDSKKYGSVLTESEKFEKAKAMLEKIRQEGSPLIKDEDAIYGRGAVDKLFVEGKIQVKTAENEALFEKTSRLMANATNESGEFQMTSQIFAAQKDREDAALRAIVTDKKKNSKLVLLVYGAAHDFKRSVETYNQRNPKKKLGLVKLTPKE